MSGLDDRIDKGIRQIEQIGLEYEVNSKSN